MTRIEHKSKIDALIQEARQDGCFAEWARYMCRTDLFFLAVYICDRSDMDEDWIHDRCMEVQREPDGYLDIWARDHYKSTIITFFKTIQDILLNPEERICIYSFNQTIAGAFVNQIKTELETNTRLKKLFPDILWADPYKGTYTDEQGVKQRIPWTTEAIRVKRKSRAKEHTVESSGLVTGQKTGGHYTLLIYDDVVTLDSVGTPDMMAKTTNAWQMSLNTGSSANGRIRMIGTRYHFADTYHTVISDGIAKPRIYPCIDAEGKPVLYSAEKIAQKKRAMGSKVFASQMLCDPKEASKVGFKEEWLRFWEPLIISNLNRYIVIDPASKKKKKSDYTTMWVIGAGSDNNFYVVDMVRDKLNLTERANNLFMLHRQYRPKGVYYEEVGLQADIEHILYVQEQQNYRFSVTPISALVPKEQRIEALIPLFEGSRIYLPNQLWKQNWEGDRVNVIHEFITEEYKMYPFLAHDDMLDGLSKIADPQVTPLIAFPDEISNEEKLREKLSKKGFEIEIDESEYDYEPY